MLLHMLLLGIQRRNMHLRNHTLLFVVRNFALGNFAVSELDQVFTVGDGNTSLSLFRRRASAIIEFLLFFVAFKQIIEAKA